MSETERNKEVIRRLLEAADRGDLEEVASCYAPDYQDHVRGGSRNATDRQGTMAAFGELARAFPACRHTIHDLIAEGEKVALRVSATGTCEGELGGIPGAGRIVEARQTVIYRLRDGLIVERWLENPVSVVEELAKARSPVGGGPREGGRRPLVVRATDVEWKWDRSGGRYWELGLDDVALTCFRLDPGVRFPAHAHVAEQVTFVLEGRLIFEVEGDRHTLGPGDAIAIPSEVEHSVTCGEEPVLAIDAWSPPPGHLGSA